MALTISDHSTQWARRALGNGDPRLQWGVPEPRKRVDVKADQLLDKIAALEERVQEQNDLAESVAAARRIRLAAALRGQRVGQPNDLTQLLSICCTPDELTQWLSMYCTPDDLTVHLHVLHTRVGRLFNPEDGVTVFDSAAPWLWPGRRRGGVLARPDWCVQQLQSLWIIPTVAVS